MTKGASIQFKSYTESVPQILNFLQVPAELKKYDKIILKPYIQSQEVHTSLPFLEAVLRFFVENKNPIAELFIAEGVDGQETAQLFESLGYQKLAEKYAVGLIDLNDTEVSEIENHEFLHFTSIHYPKILLESCVVSLPLLKEDPETGILGSLANMLGAFPAEYYAGFFSLKKSKIRKAPMKYAIHDIIKCKMPNFAIIDASAQGSLLAGLPLEMDKMGAKILGKDWKTVPYLRLVEESFAEKKEAKKIA